MAGVPSTRSTYDYTIRLFRDSLRIGNEWRIQVTASVSNQNDDPSVNIHPFQIGGVVS